MKPELRFLVNERPCHTNAFPGTPVLDYLRRELGLSGTKEGCREGDCGACAVLLGERLGGGSARYRAVPSCLLALGELEGRHLVTIEGLSAAAAAAGDAEGLGPVMRAFLEENASQCGFCSPGFIVSLSAWLAAPATPEPAGALVAVEGNLCRCTGYASILRAAGRLCREFASLPLDPDARLESLVRAGVLPPSTLDFARGTLLPAAPLPAAAPPAPPAPGGTAGLRLGGGTDWYVRNTDPEPVEDFVLLDRDPRLAGVALRDGLLELGAALSIRDFLEAPEILRALPGVEAFAPSFASLPIRNRATLGGNVANASPVADMTSLLLGLGARVRIEGGPAPRELPLERLFLGYKRLDLGPGERLAAFLLAPLGPRESLSFEKVAKRKSLDIAAVNSAARIRLSADGSRIEEARISAGGVAATPRLLARASAWLAGKPLDAETAFEASRLAASEVEPIGDVRGSAAYRGRLLGRLVLAHLVRLSPALAAPVAKELLR